MKNTNYETGMTDRNTAIGIAVAIIVLMLLLFFAFKFSQDNKVDDNVVDPATENANVNAPAITAVDLETATTNEERLPNGFPADAPIEYDALTSAVNANFESEEVQESIVVYNTNKTIAEVKEVYQEYMEANDYVVTVNEIEDETFSQVRGVGDDKVMSVVIEDLDGQIVVAVSYSESPNAVN